MTEATVRALLDAEPFEPFTIHRASKSSYGIARPESVSFPPSGANCGRFCRSIPSRASNPFLNP